MAQRVITHTILTDDMTGKELPEGQGRTIRFGLEGQWYEIDLAEPTAKELESKMSDYIDHGRKYMVSESHTRSRRTGGGNAVRHDKDETKAARAWLVEHGHLKADSRGRIASELWDLYRNRNNSPTAPTAAPAQAPANSPAAPTAAPAKPPANATPAKKAEAKAKEPAKATA
jgi:hypothetical protein